MKKIPENIQAQFEEITQNRKKELEDELILVRRILNTCDSPIEQMFLLGIYKHWASTYPFDLEISVGFQSKLTNFVSPDYRGDVSVTIFPQQWINIEDKNFRADLVLMADGNIFSPTLQNTLEVRNRSIKIVVEIDGHDYHERTKEQAQYDKSRDRILNKHGYVVVRYTGSEVFNDVYKATRELAEFILAKLFSASIVMDLFYEL